MTVNERPMVCECGSTQINTQMDVGSDIDPSGEETQHLDTCQKCGKTRLWIHRWSYEGELSAPTIHWGKWSKSKFGIDFS